MGLAEVIAVDASAVLAIVLDEPEKRTMITAIELAGGGVLSPVNWWEAAVKARTVKGDDGAKILRAILVSLNIRIAPTDEAQANAAFDAHVRFGRGTPAALNLGDCFAYALAAAEGDGLLFKGEDFPKTDARPALLDVTER
jgi:ribonuclease VapC